MLDRFLNNILDIPGTEGLSIMNREGELLVNRMPSFFVEEVFADLGRRVVSLYETVDDNFLPCEDYVLRYPGKIVYLRRSENFILLVFTSEDANLMSLKMVTNMAMKHIKPEMIDAPVKPTPAATPEKPEPAPAAAATPAEEPPKEAAANKPRRMFRGVPY